MTRRLVLTYLSLVLAVLTGLAVPLGYLYQHSEQEQAFRQLEREAEIVAAYVDAELGEDDGDQIRDIATAAAQRWGGQVELFDVSGRLMYSTRPQVIDTADVEPALGRGGRIGHRIADIDGVRMMSVSVSFHAGKPTSGAVRLSVPMSPVTEQIHGSGLCWPRPVCWPWPGAPPSPSRSPAGSSARSRRSSRRPGSSPTKPGRRPSGSPAAHLSCDGWPRRSTAPRSGCTACWPRAGRSPTTRPIS